MNGWILGYIIGAVVVVVVVAVLLALIDGARRAAVKAERIAAELRTARDRSMALNDLGDTAAMIGDVVGLATTARSFLATGHRP